MRNYNLYRSPLKIFYRDTVCDMNESDEDEDESGEEKEDTKSKYTAIVYKDLIQHTKQTYHKQVTHFSYYNGITTIPHWLDLEKFAHAKLDLLDEDHEYLIDKIIEPENCECKLDENNDLQINVHQVQECGIQGDGIGNVPNIPEGDSIAHFDIYPSNSVLPGIKQTNDNNPWLAVTNGLDGCDVVIDWLFELVMKNEQIDENMIAKIKILLFECDITKKK
eukprot:381895_1